MDSAFNQEKSVEIRMSCLFKTSIINQSIKNYINNLGSTFCQEKYIETRIV